MCCRIFESDELLANATVAKLLIEQFHQTDKYGQTLVLRICFNTFYTFYQFVTLCDICGKTKCV